LQKNAPRKKGASPLPGRKENNPRKREKEFPIQEKKGEKNVLSTSYVRGGKEKEKEALRLLSTK